MDFYAEDDQGRVFDVEMQKETGEIFRKERGFIRSD